MVFSDDQRDELKTWRRGALAAFVFLSVATASVGAIDRHTAAVGRGAIVKSGRVISVDGCNRDFRVIGVAIRIIDASAIAVKAAHTTRAEQELDSLAVSRAALVAAQPDCRKAGQIVTDDPNKVNYPPPVQLHN